MHTPRTIIIGTGCYIPTEVKKNREFTPCEFYDEGQKHIDLPTAEIVDKFKQITGIEERRYVRKDMSASDIAAEAAQRAIEDAGIDPETIDQIIVAHNFGNVKNDHHQIDTVPSLASRIKNLLGIVNPLCIPYDILFGCPGWLQGVIQADAFIKVGVSKTCLVIGTEILSRVVDWYDRDSMIFSDGSGACILQALQAENDNTSGILGTTTQSHCSDETFYIRMEPSYFPSANPNIKFMKMSGRKVYEYALKHVPLAMQSCLEKCGVEIGNLKKIFIHQANEKMDDAILNSFYKLYGINDIPENIMPMNIREFGNSSVATIPTLFDMVLKGNLPGHYLSKGDIIMFASVGAGMNINAACYRM